MRKLLLVLSLAACQHAPPPPAPKLPKTSLSQYATVRLEVDLSALSSAERAMIPLLIRAADHMDAVFWREAYGDKDALLSSIADPEKRRLAEINYGPWDRLDGNIPFIAGAGPKPDGAGFYPADLTKAEIDAYLTKHPEQAAALKSLYTVVERDGAALRAVPYRERFAEDTLAAAALLEEAAALAEDFGLKWYLMLRAEALRTDDYQRSDLAWMDMKDNRLEVVIGPIETYEERIYGAKAAHEAYVLIKDMEWSARLSRYAALLPELQRGLPVDERYKAESPGTDSDLNAYDVVYYSGDCNSGSKTIAINLPNDEEVQLQKGTRRLQLKNAIRAKFDRILVPIAKELIAEDQQKHVDFDAFFHTIMFHEVAHGLGIKNTVNGKGLVREALEAHASAIEEGKADILGLYMIGELLAKGELTGKSLEDHSVTFLAGIFRSVRFGAASAHGRANMLRFNFFAERGAFSRDEATGRYRVDFAKMAEATKALSKLILEVQGNGDREGAAKLLEEKGRILPTLEADLARLAAANIPVDVVFEQGLGVLGLE